MEREKEMILAQFTSLAEQKVQFDDAQKPLLLELNKIKEQIGEVEELKSAITVRSHAG